MDEEKGMSDAQRNLIKKKYKTKLCRHWLRLGTCNLGDKCNFAHGLYELRKKPKDYVWIDLNIS